MEEGQNCRKCPSNNISAGCNGAVLDICDFGGDQQTGGLSLLTNERGLGRDVEQDLDDLRMEWHREGGSPPRK